MSKSVWFVVSLFLCFGLCEAFRFSLKQQTLRAPASPAFQSLRKSQASRSRLNAVTNDLIEQGFNVATFLPQPFWILMIALPNANITKKIMGPWQSILFFAFVHLFIVSKSIAEPDGTAPMAEFSGVFDPSGAPLEAMLGMMKYPNFVSEEWSHVLTWDLFVGRFIWLDGIRRGIFTPHSVLLTNLIGPPGFLLHALTCTFVGKGLPVVDIDMHMTSIEGISSSSSMNLPATVGSVRADSVIRLYFANLYDKSLDVVDAIVGACDDNVVWEDLSVGDLIGKHAIREHLNKKVSSLPLSSRMVIDRISDGSKSAGYTFYLEEGGKRGIRGTTFVSVGANGKIMNVREICEPLFKPGGQTAQLLRSVTSKAIKDGKVPPKSFPVFNRRDDFSSASDMVKYLWLEVQGSDKEEALKLFSDDITYQDFNFETAFRGKAEVSDFLDEFDIPGIEFIPEMIGDGRDSCVFTWRISIAGVEGTVRGISYYATEVDQKTGKRKISYIRDIPEPAIKPPPLQTIASIIKPGLKTFA